MSMAPFRRSKPRETAPLPAVKTGSGALALDIGGRRLETLGLSWLTVTCACGHEGKVSVADLADRHGSRTRVREALALLRCSQCGAARVRRTTLVR
ncbi:hypothetical protein [Ruegeria sp.]|uniref:hypothetical protein n=1 Tax=Ruegeria sp. TaxID=1879320 RepID=UPI003B005C17